MITEPIHVKPSRQRFKWQHNGHWHVAQLIRDMEDADGDLLMRDCHSGDLWCVPPHLVELYNGEETV